MYFLKIFIEFVQNFLNANIIYCIKKMNEILIFFMCDLLTVDNISVSKA